LRAFDQLRMKLLSEEEAIVRLGSRTSEFGRELIDTLKDIKPMRGARPKRAGWRLSK
jgi:hypothetical protein